MARLKYVSLSLAAILLLGQAVTASGKPAPIPYNFSDRFVTELLDGRKIINVVDDLLAFWEQAKGLPLRRQRRLWKLLVESKYPDYFERAVYRNAELGQRRAMLDEFLSRLPDHVDAIREFNYRVSNSIVEGIINFKIRFPEYRQQRDIYVGLSLFRFDGSVRSVHNEVGVPDTLCLGADVLARYTNEEFQITIAHEFFHLYHFGFLFRHPALARQQAAHLPLMIEGMAVAGAEAVYPYQSRAMYLHFSDEELAAQQEDIIPNSNRFLELINKNAPAEQYGQWFTKSASTEAPPRGGYLLGYEVTKRVLAALTIEQMVRLTPSQLREHAEEQLAAMTTDRVMLVATPD